MILAGARTPAGPCCGAGDPVGLTAVASWGAGRVHQPERRNHHRHRIVYERSPAAKWAVPSRRAKQPAKVPPPVMTASARDLSFTYDKIPPTSPVIVEMRNISRMITVRGSAGALGLRVGSAVDEVSGMELR